MLKILDFSIARENLRYELQYSNTNTGINSNKATKIFGPVIANQNIFFANYRIDLWS